MSPFHYSLPRMVRRCAAAGLGAYALALAAPATTPPVGPEAAATVAVEPAYTPPENARELLTFDEPMRQFFSTRVDRRQAEAVRLQQIVVAILRPDDGLGFTYDSNGTSDARETFRRRRGSCVSFAFLVMAVAREYGLAAQFQEFETRQRWNRFEQFLASIRHTNVRVVTSGGEVFVVDLRPDLAPPEWATDNRFVVPDKRAFAHFYSTAGFFRLVGGDVAGAQHLMDLGATCDPKSPIVWANLGNVYAETGDLAKARSCFEKSLKLDSHGELALVSLVGVLRRLGGPEELKLADKYEKRAQTLRLGNPYYHHHLAEDAQTAGDWAGVETHVRQAIKLKDDEPLFHEMLVQALRQLGRAAEAERAAARLAKLRARLAAVAPKVMR